MGDSLLLTRATITGRFLLRGKKNRAGISSPSVKWRFQAAPSRGFAMSALSQGGLWSGAMGGLRVCRLHLAGLLTRRCPATRLAAGPGFSDQVRT